MTMVSFRSVCDGIFIFFWHTACKRMINLCQVKKPLSVQETFVRTRKLCQYKIHHPLTHSVSLSRQETFVMTKPLSGQALSSQDSSSSYTQCIIVRFLVLTKVSCPDKGSRPNLQALYLTKVFFYFGQAWYIGLSELQRWTNRSLSTYTIFKWYIKHLWYIGWQWM